jgi:peptidoglycan/xylan/chitin deacetylase (PgdA/CDA1 family)
LLEKYGLKATFYIPLSNPENKVMDKSLIRQISQYQEVGGHTLNHKYLTTINKLEATYEIEGCKEHLEDITGDEITAFCFPGGKYNVRDIQLIKNAGFLFGRTTTFFKTSFVQNTHDSLMHTTIQAYNHQISSLVIHCLKRFEFEDLIKFNFKSYNIDFIKLAEYYLNKPDIEVFHLWGHSWEIEKYNLWREVEVLFNIIGFRSDVTYLNNTESWKLMKKI